MVHNIAPHISLAHHTGLSHSLARSLTHYLQLLPTYSLLRRELSHTPPVCRRDEEHVEAGAGAGHEDHRGAPGEERVARRVREVAGE
jgi:hypothetical protein